MIIIDSEKKPDNHIVRYEFDEDWEHDVFVVKRIKQDPDKFEYTKIDQSSWKREVKPPTFFLETYEPSAIVAKRLIRTKFLEIVKDMCIHVDAEDGTVAISLFQDITVIGSYSESNVTCNMMLNIMFCKGFTGDFAKNGENNPDWMPRVIHDIANFDIEGYLNVVDVMIT